jgi:hypothetical protein
MISVDRRIIRDAMIVTVLHWPGTRHATVVVDYEYLLPLALALISAKWGSSIEIGGKIGF